MPLNFTNFDACAEICGDDTDDWPGKRIELYPAKTQMGGKMVDCIRIGPPAQRELPKQIPPAPKPPRTNDVDDTIPFQAGASWSAPPLHWLDADSRYFPAGRKIIGRQQIMGLRTQVQTLL